MKTTRSLAMAVMAFTVGLALTGTARLSAAEVDLHVSSPPPPPRSEQAWARPYAQAVWIAGHYEPRGGTWVWIAGYYVFPPHPGAKWTRGYYAHGEWHPGRWGRKY